MTLDSACGKEYISKSLFLKRKAIAEMKLINERKYRLLVVAATSVTSGSNGIKLTELQIDCGRESNFNL